MQNSFFHYQLLKYYSNVLKEIFKTVCNLLFTYCVCILLIFVLTKEW